MNDDAFRESRDTFRPKFSKAINTPEEYKKLEIPVASESEQERAIAKDFVAKLRRPYKDVPRTRWTGPESIGQSMELREDMYSVVYLYKMKRMTIFDDDREDIKRTRHFSRESLGLDKDKSNFYKDF